MSTRRADSFGVTVTRAPLLLVVRGSSPASAGLKACTTMATPIAVTAIANATMSSLALRLLMRHPRIAACDDHFLFRVIERHTLAGMNRGDRHAERDRMAVAGRLDRRVRRFPAAHALHPIPHVRRRHRVGARVGRGFGFLRAIDERPLGEE